MYRIPFLKYQIEKCDVCMNSCGCIGAGKVTDEEVQRCMIMCATYNAFK